MQMSHFRAILIKLSLKYIPRSFKRCNINACILNGYKDMPFWHLQGPFRTTAIIYTYKSTYRYVTEIGLRMCLLLPSPKLCKINSVCIVIYFNLDKAVSYQHGRRPLPWLSRAMRKCVLCHMRTTKAQISLRIRAVGSAHLLFAA